MPESAKYFEPIGDNERFVLTQLRHSIAGNFVRRNPYAPPHRGYKLMTADYSPLSYLNSKSLSRLVQLGYIELVQRDPLLNMDFNFIVHFRPGIDRIENKISQL